MLYCHNVDAAAGTAHASSATETAIASHSFPANFFKGGQVIKWECVLRATATVGADTLDTVAYFGVTTLTTAICTTNQVNAVDDDIIYMTGTITMRDVDTSGTYVAATRTANLAASAATAGHESHVTITTAMDLTAAMLLEVGCDWDTANANSVQTEVFNVWVESGAER